MRVYNTGDSEIRQLYNNKPVVIPTGKEMDVFDDLGVFLLNKRDIRGFGLVQFKDGDNKADRYKQGRHQIYMWATEKYNDYIKHCEERREINQSPIPPHKEILEYKKTMEAYEKWESEGFPMPEGFDKKPPKDKIYACPQCSQEFVYKALYFEHLKTHESEENGVNLSTTADKSS
jgi:hypothetical protein